MRKLIFCTAFLTVSLSVGACHSAPKPVFVVNNLLPTDGDIKGCNTVLERAGTTNHQRIFFESAGETGADGYIRIDGHLIHLTLLHGANDKVHAVRSFSDAANTMSVISSYDIGKTHPENGSTELTGTLTVTYKGMTQILPFGGGTAC